MAHPLAGHKAQIESLINVDALVAAYYANTPDCSMAAQRVSFGTSGHRGKSSNASFTDAHVAAITQAICDGREQFGATGICYVGQDTHALSQPALKTVREVLAGNGVIAGIDASGDFVPTPSVSRAIIRENAKVKAGGHLVDGIIITPSHNPPDDGGIKYNPINGGPADTVITKWIEDRANSYLENNNAGVKRIAFEEIPPTLQQLYEFKKLYVQELAEILNMDIIQAVNPRVLVNALGGSGMAYWQTIKETYNLNLDIVNGEYDPTFSFMSYDHDGVIRMDCSSEFAMTEVIKQIGEYDLAVGNDPDYDRYGIVTDQGLLNANKYLATAGSYLFGTRQWGNKGFGKTVVVTNLVDRLCADRHIPVYEVPVGFKYFADLLFEGQVGIAGEESAGASFLKKDGTVWTTDKDGIVMALLSLEILAATGKDPAAYYEGLAKRYGSSVFSRTDAACTPEEKTVLKALNPTAVKATALNGETIIDIRTTSLYKDYDIGGLRITTDSGWVVARPSGTENLYKIYGESFKGESELESLLSEGQKLVSQALKK